MLIEIISDDELLEQISGPEPGAATEEPDYERKRKFKPRLRREEAGVDKREEVPIHESEAEQCSILWRSVVMQALYDISGKGGNFERKLIRSEAMSWFARIGAEGQSDFEYVCELADMLPEKVMSLVKKVRERGEDLIENTNFRSVRRDCSDRRVRTNPRKSIFKTGKKEEK